MRIAVLGAAGQLGRDLCPRLPGEVIPLSRAEIDLTRPDLIPGTIAALRLDAFINCAAYNLVDDAERLPEAAFAANAIGVRAIAAGCRAAGVRLVHFSTDYVFGLNASTSPLTEDSLPGPLSAYGASKLAGEHFVLAEAADALVIRSCGLYGVWGSGGKGGNFVEAMLRLAAQEKPVRVVDDQRCAPTYTVDVATATVVLLQAGARGLFHVTNSGDCNWFEFAAEIFRQANLSPNLTPVSSALFGRPARRPPYSVLSTKKLADAVRIKPRPWRDALADYLEERRRKGG